jgi:hypothetical protein
MDTGKPPGWYYVGQGRFRYRDESGPTEHFMQADDPRLQPWPPPPPNPNAPGPYVQQVLDAMGERPASKPGLLQRLRRRM